MPRSVSLDTSQFYHPKDNLTKIYNKIMDENDKLPPTFYNNNTDDSYGIGNLEIKKSFMKPIKTIPEFSKLIKGDYETEKSSSDGKIAKDITFIRNNLPSFQKYKDVDRLDWVIKEHRKLFIEILDYYTKRPSSSLTTIEGRVVGMMRIFYIAYENKQYELYKKYSAIVFDLRDYFKLDENKQELNPREEKAFIPFEVILAKQQQMAHQFNGLKNKTTNDAYKLNQDLLLVSLYSLIPPNRDEIKELHFTTTPKTDKDYIYIKGDEVFMLLNKIKKRHDGIKINITEESKELADILTESYKLYPREFVFTQYDKRDIQIKITGLNKRLLRIFSFTGKNVGTNSLRSSYASYLNQQKQLSVYEKDKLASRMRTSRRFLDEAYIKLGTPVNEYKNKEVVVINEDKQQPMGRYSQHLEANKRYYENHKQAILERVRNHYNKQDKTELARKKIIYYLNNDNNYKNKIKETTLKKYDIKIVDGVYQ